MDKKQYLWEGLDPKRYEIIDILPQKKQSAVIIIYYLNDKVLLHGHLLHTYILYNKYCRTYQLSNYFEGILLPPHFLYNQKNPCLQPLP